MNTQESMSSMISLRDALFIIFSKKHIVVGVFFFVVAATILYSLITPKVYEVSSVVLVKPTVEANLYFRAASERLNVEPVTPEIINSEIAIMRSEELLRQVVKKLGLEKKETGKNPIEKAVGRLQSTIKISPVTLSNTIKASLKGNDPVLITKIINTLVEKFFDRHIDVHQTKGGVQFFSEEAKVYLKKLKESEDALNAFQNEWSIIDIQAQRENNLRALVTLRENLSLVRGQIAERETRLTQLKENKGALPSTFTDATHLIEFQKNLYPLLVEQYRIAQLFTQSSSRYREITQQVEQVREEITREQDKIMQGVKVDLEALKSHEQELLNEIKALEDMSLLLTDKETEYNRLSREVKQNEKDYLLFRDKTEEVRIEEQKNLSRVSNVSVVSWAHKPTIPVFPRKTAMAMIACVMGLFLGVAGAHIAYYLDHTIKQPEDFPRHLGFPILGALPMIDSEGEVRGG